MSLKKRLRNWPETETTVSQALGNNLLLVLILSLCGSGAIQAQGLVSSANVTGNIQLDFQYYKEDTAINFTPFDKTGLNSWTEVLYRNKGFTAGLRYEAFQPPLVGYNAKIKNQGFPYKFISYSKEGLTATAGSYYAQFGSGLLLRTYQDKGLGIDNALDGVKIEYNILDKIYLTALQGKPRYFWSKDTSRIRGVDAEVFVTDFINKESELKWKVGGSYVNRNFLPAKFDTTYPEYVEAYAVRSSMRYKNFAIEGEIAQKGADPMLVLNQGNDTAGYAYYANASFSTKGLGISAQYKGVSQFDFRSNPTAFGLEYFLNFLPPITKFHSLKEFTRYPFVSSGLGEQGIQGEITYSIKRGQTILVNYSKVHDENWKEKYYESVYVEADWKFSKKLKGIFAYHYIDYDFILQQKTLGKLFAHIYLADMSYRVAKKTSLRAEVQYLTTAEDKGDWIFGIIEAGFAPHFTVSFSNEVNLGKEPEVHYYSGSFSYTKGSHKFIFTGGRQSQGYQCAGGICRLIPAYYGVGFTLLSSF